MKFTCDNSFCAADLIHFVEHKLMHPSNMFITFVYFVLANLMNLLIEQYNRIFTMYSHLFMYLLSSKR